MKRIVFIIVMFSVVLLSSTIAASTPQSVEVTRNIASKPLAFTANQGQWDQQVMFQTSAGGATMWFTSNSATYQFTRRVGTNNNVPFSIVDKRYGIGAGGRQTSRSAPDDVLGRHHQPDSIESIAIKASFIGANPNPQIVGLEELEYKCNYFIGNDPNKWHTDVPNYSAVVYEQVYDGIDLKYYGNGKQMEYDFIVSPGADFSQIEIQYEGAESVSINANGELIVATKWGDVVEQRPVIYQIDNNSRIAVTGEYRLKGNNSFGFDLGSSYNPALPLVIDPVLSYSTYLGGSNTDYGYDIAVDGSGNTFVTGITFSSDFPTLNPYQPHSGNDDVFVTKLSSSGSSLIYSTYLGGFDSDNGWGVSVDASGAAYVTGLTLSPDFPTLNPFQAIIQGGTDVFVTKLSSSGNSLVYSTYLGGIAWDWGRDISVDGSGSAYVMGYTMSSDFPILNAYQAYQGNYDAFVTKLSTSGSSLVYSTYLGGTDFDYGIGISVDASNSAYVTGYTMSSDFPTLNPYQTYQGNWDAFVTKLSSSGNSLIYSTYLGGTNAEEGYGISVDASGSAYITGKTMSSDYPTMNPYQGTNQGYSEVFVTKLSSSGNSLIYSTYLGGINPDEGYAISVDASGAAYVTGSTVSADFPIVNPYQGTYQGGGDAFVTKLSSSGNSLTYSTFLGGSSADVGQAVSLGASGTAYVIGYTQSSDFPTLNPYQTFQGGQDAFVTKFTEANDADGDGIPDALDNCPNTYNPAQTDTDGDGVGDACDICPGFEDNIDTDSDGVPDGCDVCPGFDDGVDSDLDGVPDGCDICPGFDDNHDIDFDGVPDGCDLCPGQDDAADADGDGMPDACDICPGFDDNLDTDSDGVPDGCDNCPSIPNPLQEDTDSDGIGDACESCCIGTRGDVNGDGNDLDIVDLTTVVDFLFGVTPPIPCPEESDVNGDGSGLPDIVDLTFIVDWLFGVQPTLVPCP